MPNNPNQQNINAVANPAVPRNYAQETLEGVREFGKTSRDFKFLGQEQFLKYMRENGRVNKQGNVDYSRMTDEDGRKIIGKLLNVNAKRVGIRFTQKDKDVFLKEDDANITGEERKKNDVRRTEIATAFAGVTGLNLSEVREKIGSGKMYDSDAWHGDVGQAANAYAQQNSKMHIGMKITPGNQNTFYQQLQLIAAQYGDQVVNSKEDMTKKLMKYKQLEDYIQNA